MSEETKIKDESQDQKYFTITPRLVWAYARNPYDYTLWSTIKGIAGESGECYLATDDLAALSMMSAGMVSESRKYWMDVGLLKGECRKDPGYPQPVWHLRIPNVWKQNIEWAEANAGLKDRVEFKRTQTEKIRAQRESARLAEKQKKSLEEAQKSLHLVKASPDEEGTTPGEEGLPPGELKNIHQKNQEEEPLAGGKKTPPADWGVAWQIAAGVDQIVLPTEDELQAAKLANAVEMFAQPYKAFAQAFILATGIFPIQKDVSGWSLAFKDQQARTGLSTDDITDACKQMFKEELTIKDPFSVMNKVPNIRAARKQKTAQTPWTGVNTEFAHAVETYVPRQRPQRPGQPQA